MHTDDESGETYREVQHGLWRARYASVLSAVLDGQTRLTSHFVYRRDDAP